uniref:Uncharacterized protein n=1 Tax=Noccaea caerulescens TaxID=107243 RepID=A0A1J3GPI4_NOCCA
MLLQNRNIRKGLFLKSFPDVIVAWVTTFLSNVGDLKAGVVGLASFPVGRKNSLRPEHFAVVACSHHKPELKSSGGHFVSEPDGSVASGHVTPVRGTNLSNVDGYHFGLASLEQELYRQIIWIFA